MILSDPKIMPTSPGGFVHLRPRRRLDAEKCRHRPIQVVFATDLQRCEALLSEPRPKPPGTVQCSRPSRPYSLTGMPRVLEPRASRSPDHSVIHARPTIRMSFSEAVLAGHPPPPRLRNGYGGRTPSSRCRYAPPATASGKRPESRCRSGVEGSSAVHITPLSPTCLSSLITKTISLLFRHRASSRLSSPTYTRMHDEHVSSPELPLNFHGNRSAFPVSRLRHGLV